MSITGAMGNHAWTLSVRETTISKGGIDWISLTVRRSSYFHATKQPSILNTKPHTTNQGKSSGGDYQHAAISKTKGSHTNAIMARTFNNWKGDSLLDMPKGFIGGPNHIYQQNTLARKETHERSPSSYVVNPRKSCREWVFKSEVINRDLLNMKLILSVDWLVLLIAQLSWYCRWADKFIR